MKNSVVVANTEDINGFIKNKTPVSMIGYGLQNPSQRLNFEWGSFSPMKMTSYMVSNEELRNYYKINANNLYEKPGQTILDYGILNSAVYGSNCDGDSGSGFFVESGNIRYYLGPAGGSQAGITNCQSFTRFGIGGGMSGITATNKFLDLIKTAENIVAEDKRQEFLKAEEARLTAELKAKQEAEAEAKIIAEIALKIKQEAELKVKIEEEQRLKIEKEIAELLKNNQIFARKLYAGKSCNKIRSTKIVYDIKFTCIKKNKKLMWNQGT